MESRPTIGATTNLGPNMFLADGAFRQKKDANELCLTVCSVVGLVGYDIDER